MGEKETIDEEVSVLESILGELGNINKKYRGLRNAVIAIVAVGVLSFGTVGWVAWDNHHDNKAQDKADARETSRVTAALVGNCAVGNVVIGFQHDNLASIKVDKPFVMTPAFESWLDKRLEVLQPVECKAIVPPELGTANLCLQYPDRIDPDTGLPIPTSTTPENGAACRKLEAK